MDLCIDLCLNLTLDLDLNLDLNLALDLDLDLNLDLEWIFNDFHRFSLLFIAFSENFTVLNPKPCVFIHFHEKVMILRDVFAESIKKHAVYEGHFSKCR